jgi:hypothetical protein
MYASIFIVLFTSCVPFFSPVFPGKEPPDTNPPADVKDLYVIVESGAIKLTWNDPTNPDFDHIEILFTEGEHIDGTDTTDFDPVIVLPGIKEYVFADILPDVVYTINIKTVDTVGNKSDGIIAIKMAMAFFYNIPDMQSYLSAKNANTAATPYGVQLIGVDLSDPTVRDNLFAALTEYVYLDLHECIGIEEWNRYTNAEAAKITHLVLPDSVITIGSGISLEGSTFGEYTELKMIEANNVRVLGAYALSKCVKITQVNMPLLRILQVGAFSGCTGIVMIKLPQARVFYAGVFYGCSSLRRIDTLHLSSIYEGAFARCNSLVYISFGDVPPTKLGPKLFEGVSRKKVELVCNISRRAAFLNCLKTFAASFRDVTPRLRLI